MNRFDRTRCPVCRETVQVARLNYKGNVQRTECPEGHEVERIWNGPERPDWDRGTEPYGWSGWYTEPYGTPGWRQP